MTDEEFEDAYREALLCLSQEHRRVGKPEIVDANRVCMIDGKYLNDYEVLKLFWGKEIAQQIRRSRRARFHGKSHNAFLRSRR
jgi:hypothetical protein